MRLPRIRTRDALFSLAVFSLALLAGGALDPALEWAHNRLLASSSPTIVLDLDFDRDAQQQRQNPDAVVVLGYALNRDGTPTVALAHRVRAAVREWERACKSDDDGNDIDVPFLVFSGGHPGGGVGARGNRSEAEAMRSLALSEIRGRGQKGGRGKEEEEMITYPPPFSWVLEEASTSTWENAAESLHLLQQLLLEKQERQGRRGREKEKGEAKRPPLSISIATSPFHQRRALATFRCAASALEREEKKKIKTTRDKKGDDDDGENDAAARFTFSAAPSPRPPPSSPAQRAERAFEAAREVAAIAWYAARGRLC